MHNLEIVIFLLAIITGLAAVADKLKTPYPILLVIIGLAIGFIPGLPVVALNPDVVFLIFLPPLLYAAAWTTSWHDFKAAKRPIGLMAIGLVLFTTSLVAVIAHAIIPDFTWPMSFLLGAIISPPDAVAATSVTKGFGLPKRVITILEGESLVNDASGLIAYRYAVIAVTTGNFVLWQAGLQFLIVAVAGIVVGLVTGWILGKMHQYVNNATVETSMTLLSPFVSYLIAESFHVSGVLAVVTTGLYLSWRSPEIFAHETRINAYSVWNIVVFILNGIIFILIGLQLPAIIGGTGVCSTKDLILYTVIISIATMLIRILWIFPGAYLPRMLSKKIRETEPNPDWKTVMIVAWTGMRGVVSLAAALALPVTMPNGQPFPGRDIILFITFGVILFTLVLQGVSLPVLIRKLGIKPQTNDGIEEKETRIKIAISAITHLEENFAMGVPDDVLNQVKNKYELRISHLNKRVRTAIDAEMKEDIAGELFGQFHKLQYDLIRHERAMVIQMHKAGTVSEEVLRKLEYELDLEESKLSMEAEL